MKIEKLTENKIRIIIDIDELNNKNISLKSLSQNSTDAQNLFAEILSEAEKKVGFKVSGSRLLIEAFSTSEGTVVITFTKIKLDNILSFGKPKTLKYRRKVPCSSCKNAVYEFDSFDEFCNFCTYLNNSHVSDLKGFAKITSLYEYNSKYYLTFSGINIDFEHIAFFYASISEFAKLISNSNTFESKLVEHGNCIFKRNAIKNCIKYFSNSRKNEIQTKGKHF